ncbi:hypothetical protein WAI453_000502 [Rhynchosporium graminicola]
MPLTRPSLLPCPSSPLNSRRLRRCAGAATVNDDGSWPSAVYCTYTPKRARFGCKPEVPEMRGYREGELRMRMGDEEVQIPVADKHHINYK